MTKLRAKKPETKEKRLKMFIYGPAGVGKTIAALQFPEAYIIDTEKGTDFYSDTINQSKSVVFQSSSSDEIKTEIKNLLTEKHDYKTLIIDPITILYMALQEKWNLIFEKHAKTQKEAEIQDFGMRYWSKVKSEYKALQRLIMALDMNVIITSHQKDVYGQGFSKVGVTWDSMKGDDYLFDYVFQIAKNGSNETPRKAIKIKERSEIGKEKFPENFIWSYENFLKFYGKEILEKTATPVKMASKEQIEKMKRLSETINLDQNTIAKWFQKANVDEWEEMNDEQITKCISYIEKKIKEANA